MSKKTENEKDAATSDDVEKILVTEKEEKENNYIRITMEGGIQILMLMLYDACIRVKINLSILHFVCFILKATATFFYVSYTLSFHPTELQM